MKIELIKLKFNNTYSYKYKPFKHCCKAIENNESIIFTGEDLVCNDLFGLVVRDSDENTIPQFCTTHTKIWESWGDEFEETENYPIQYCPHCGKKIEIAVVNEIDVSEEYNKLSKQREDLWNMCQKIDSKKKASELIEQIKKLDEQINGFYELSEWDGE